MSEYEHNWLRPERPVEKKFSVPELNFFTRDDEIGLFTDEAPFKTREEEAAFLFGETPDELWFRPSYTTLVKIKIGEDDKEDVQRLFHEQYGYLWDSSVDGLDGMRIPVYRNALGFLPLIRESRPTVLAPGRETEAYKATAPVLEERIGLTLTEEFQKRNGILLTTGGPEDERLYKVATARLEKRYYLFVLAPISGEVSICTRPSRSKSKPNRIPWQVGECGFENPVFQAYQMSLFLKKATGVEFVAFVLVPDECQLKVLRDIELSWRLSDVNVCRLTPDPETITRTLAEALDGFILTPETDQELQPDDIRAILQKFSDEDRLDNTLEDA